MKMLFDEFAQLNRRFDEQDERWTRRFNGLERSISERSTATVRRIDALEASHSSAVSDLSRHVADLESAPADPQPLAATARIATLEANYADRDAEFNKRLADLEALHHVTASDKLDNHMATLEAYVISSPKPLFFIHRFSFMVMHLFFLGLLHHRYQFYLTLFSLPTHKPSWVFNQPFVHPCLIPIG
jgi:hypothetical protein